MKKHSKIALMSGGTTEEEDSFYEMRLKQYSYVIAVDMGMEVFMRLGKKPDILIGDLDSISAQTLQELDRLNITTHLLPKDKDKSDTQLALDFAIELGYLDIDIFGGIGSRLDHTFANLYLLTYANSKGAKVSLINPWHEIQLITANKPYSTTGKQGDIISLLPVTLKIEGVYIKGCKWNLEDAKINRGQSHGLSNCIKDKEVHITVKKGMAFVFKVKEK